MADWSSQVRSGLQIPLIQIYMQMTFMTFSVAFEMYLVYRVWLIWLLRILSIFASNSLDFKATEWH
jgi:hypothetical protein